MHTYDNNYSRFVAYTKVILPIIALGILSTLFLLSRDIDTSQSIPFADVDLNELAREQRIGAPNYAGVTADGSAISITAASATPNPDDPKRVTANNMTTIIEDASGARIDISAKTGVIDSDQKRVILSDGVQILTSTGYIIHTEGLRAALDETSITSDGRITAVGPLGTLNAGQMVLSPQNKPGQSHLLVFKGGVKLIYDPKGN